MSKPMFVSRIYSTGSNWAVSIAEHQDGWVSRIGPIRYFPSERWTKKQVEAKAQKTVSYLDEHFGEMA